MSPLGATASCGFSINESSKLGMILNRIFMFLGLVQQTEEMHVISVSHGQILCRHLIKNVGYNKS